MVARQQSIGIHSADCPSSQTRELIYLVINIAKYGIIT